MGGGWKHTEKWKQENSIRNKGKKFSPEHIEARKNGLKRAWEDPEKREIMVQKIKERCNTPEHLEMLSKTHKNKILSKETLEKVKKTWFPKGHISKNKGIPHSLEHKEKLKIKWSENKEWRKSKQNISGLILQKPKPIGQYDLQGNFIRNWNSISEASIALNIPNGSISKVANDCGLKKTGGFVFKFI